MAGAVGCMHDLTLGQSLYRYRPITNSQREPLDRPLSASRFFLEGKRKIGEHPEKGDTFELVQAHIEARCTHPAGELPLPRRLKLKLVML